MRRARIGLMAAAGLLLPWLLGCSAIDGRELFSPLQCALGLDRPCAASPAEGEQGCPPQPGCGGACPGHAGCSGACIAEADHVHPRFHPVPTRPVFGPRPAPPPPILGGPFPVYPGGYPPEQPASPHLQNPAGPIQPTAVPSPPPPGEEAPPAPLPPGDRPIEAVPPPPPRNPPVETPPPPPPQDRRAQVPRQLEMVYGNPNPRSWIFPPMTAGRGLTAGQRQASQTNAGPVIR